MKEVFGRAIKVGDLVMDGHKGTADKDCYGIISGENLVYKGSSKNVHLESVYLVENPCMREQEIYTDLITKYNNLRIEKEKNKQVVYEETRVRTNKRRCLRYNIGDVLHSYNTNWYYIYLGKVILDFNGNSYGGYGYLELNKRVYEKLAAVLNSDVDIFMLNVIRGLGAVKVYKNTIDAKDISLIKIYKSKAYRFDEVVGYVTVGDTFTGVYLNVSFVPYKIKYTLTVLRQE